MHKPYILAHDAGTGGDKAVLTDLRGRIVGSAYQAYGLSYPRPDWAEQDPDELWNAVAGTTRHVLEKTGVNPAEILGVGISAQMFNLLPVDERSQPLTPGSLTRATASRRAWAGRPARLCGVARRLWVAGLVRFAGRIRPLGHGEAGCFDRSGRQSPGRLAVRF